jgi:hypothetical protein
VSGPAATSSPLAERGVVRHATWVADASSGRYTAGMRLLFIHGPPAAGKLTVGRVLAARTGMRLFHNHLVVDAVAALFPFGSSEFVRLRELFWLESIAAAARTGTSLIFTFNPEPSVSDDFPDRVVRLVRDLGGETLFVALRVEPHEQERRIDQPTRQAFGKLRSVTILRELAPLMAECEERMPAPVVAIDTTLVAAEDAATIIMDRIGP